MDFLKLDLIGQRNQRIDAVIRPLDPINDVLSWFCEWFPRMHDMDGRKLYEESHWKVDEKFEYFENEENCHVYILEALDRIQGYIIIKLDYIGSDN